MSDYPCTLNPGQVFHIVSGSTRHYASATEPTIIHDEDEALNFVSKYKYPVSFKPGDTIKLLGRSVVTAVPKKFLDYRSMEWWCMNADGIPEIGLYDAV